MSASERSDILIKGIIGWTIAFGVLPIAWIAQVMRRQTTKSA